MLILVGTNFIALPIALLVQTTNTPYLVTDQVHLYHLKLEHTQTKFIILNLENLILPKKN